MATGANLQELLKSAEEAVEVIKDDERKRIAFERVLDHLLKTTDGNQAGEARPPAPPVNDTPPPVDSAFASEQQRIDAVAEYFGVDPEQVPDLFDLSDEDPGLRLGSNKLSKSKASSTREIALLITGVRTALGRDTNTEIIREFTDEYGRLDPSNFMKILNNMPQLSLLGKRRSSNRAVRMKFLGAEATRKLVQQLIDG